MCGANFYVKQSLQTADPALYGMALSIKRHITLKSVFFLLSSPSDNDNIIGLILAVRRPYIIDLPILLGLMYMGRNLCSKLNIFIFLNS